MAEILPDAIDPDTPTHGTRSPPARNRSQHLDYTTPATNSIAGSQASEAAKARLSSHAPDGERCLITRDRRPLNCSHIVARATHTNNIEELEDSWGFTTDTIHLHTSRNMIWLRADLHTTFDFGDWALVPSVPTLESILARTVMNQDEKPCPPYKESLGDLKSHTHPFFVICNAAVKELGHRQKWDYSEDNGKGPLSPPARSLYRNHLALCVKIFAFWAPTWYNSLLLPPLPPSPPVPPRFLEPPTIPTPSRSSSRTCAPRHTTNPPLQQQEAGKESRRASETQDAEYSPVIERADSSSTNCVEVGLLIDHHSSTAESSTKPVTHDEDFVEVNFHRDTASTRYWTSVEDWTESVETSASYCEPYNLYKRAATLDLEDYGKEQARRPPGGPWEKWTPEHAFI
ncbi:hypothetical protein BN14_04573 [Rhizoctonia solani AG-1 IB]|uniref:HNH nuclease domain-containing protein n=1 Tax=Thanatephorus cucumeris (strain AG1-IB / isolate 7/3/14) TaxID=1108050 RepID=M5BTK0_THACB|nr:hypothetical protein BN14_04573 [Rhizoctonia solani AG-1 IB]